MGNVRRAPARSGSWLLMIVVVLGVSVPAQAQRWKTLLPGSGNARVVTLLPGGDPVVAGYTGTPATVARLASADGAVVWRRDVRGTAPPTGYDAFLSAIAVDAAGENVYFGGRVRNADTSWDFTVVRLAAADGAVVWRRDIDGAATDPPSFPYFDHVWTLAVDTAGDVIAGGDLIDVGTDPAFTVVKLSGVDGSMVWETQLDATLRGSARRVLVDAVGDVLVVGYTSAQQVSLQRDAHRREADGVTGEVRWRYHAVGYGVDAAFGPDGNLLVVDYEFAAKLDPSNGTEVWHKAFTGYVLLESNIAVDANGDVVTGGTVSVPASGDIKMGLLKFSGVDGAEIWRAGFPGVFGRVQGVGVDAAGDAFATGPARPEDDPAGPIDMAVAKIAGASGAFLWYRAFGIDDGLADLGERVAVDAAGDVVAVGSFYDGVDFVHVTQFAAVKLNGVAGGDQPLPGSGLTLRDLASRPRKLTLKASHRLAAPLPVIDDAAPTLGGGTVEVTNPTTGEQAAIALPAAGWLALGTPPGVGGYRYTDSRRTLGPCTKAELRAHRTRLQCQGDGIPFTLDEPSQGSLRVTIATGTDLLARCFEFAAPRRDVPGLFSARRSPAPATCQ